MPQRSRPILIKLSLAFLVLTLLAHLLVLYRTSTALLASGLEGLAIFSIAIATTILQLFTLEMVRKAAPWGRRLAVLTFTLMGLTGIYNALVIYQWPEPATNLFLAKALVLIRVAVSFFFVIAFATSKSIEEYFSNTAAHVSIESELLPGDD
jgi:hypothetical protein